MIVVAIKLSDHFTYGRLVRFALPSIAMMIFTSIYSVVDGLFVSNFAGKEALAAVNLVFPLAMALGSVGFMFGTGGAALVAKTMGEGDAMRANRLFSFIAVALTLYFPTVLSLQMTAYTMYGAAITPAILFALFSKKVTPAGGMAGILVGGLVTIIWTLMGTPGGVQCAIVAVPASVIAILLVSAVTKNSDPARSLDALYTDN